MPSLSSEADMSLTGDPVLHVFVQFEPVQTEKDKAVNVDMISSLIVH